MCGIVGIIAKNGTLTGNQDEIFEELLYADGLRGLDSTGVFGVTSKNQVPVVKQAVEPGMFVRTRSWKDFKKDMHKFKAVVGHNRKATMGEIVSKNAHPFVSKGIVLVHNGYIANHKVLDPSADVDSQAIITALDKAQDPVKGIDTLSGAYATVWYNHRTRLLHMSRNNDRPLFLCHTKEYVYFASEEDMLKWILKRNHVHDHQEPFNIPSRDVFSIEFPYKMKIQSLPAMSTLPVRHTPPAVWWDGAMACDFELEPRGEELNDRPLPPPPVEHQEPHANVSGDRGNDLRLTMSETYPFGSRVLFMPTGFTDAGSYVHVNGYCWRVGQKPYPATTTLGKKEDRDEWYIGATVPVLATVQSILRKNDSISFILQNINRDNSRKLKDWNGNYLSDNEWKQITEKLACDKCAKPIAPGSVDVCVINRGEGLNFGAYKCVCADCTTANYSKSSKGS